MAMMSEGWDEARQVVQMCISPLAAYNPITLVLQRRRSCPQESYLVTLFPSTTFMRQSNPDIQLIETLNIAGHKTRRNGVRQHTSPP
jgi:hypothetical protein